MVKDPTGEKQGFEQMLPASTAAELRERVFGRQVTEPDAGYAVAEAEAMGAAEAAHAYINDAFVLKEQGAALSLVSNAGRAGGDEHARAMYDVNDKLGKIYAAPGPARLKLGELESKLLAALRTRKLPDDLSMSEIDAAIAEAVAEANGHGADSPEEKKEKLWNEIQRLNEENKKDLSDLAKAGYVTDEQQKHIAELEENLRKAEAEGNEKKRIAAQRALTEYQKQIGVEAQGKALAVGDIPAAETAGRLLERIDTVQKKENEFENLLAAPNIGRDENKSKVQSDTSLKVITALDETQESATQQPLPKSIITIAAADASNAGLPSVKTDRSTGLV